MPDDIRPDDLSILSDDRLLRRVRPNQLAIESDGRQRPSSAVFRTAELSVYIGSLMTEQGRPPEDALAEHPGEFLCSITAGQVRRYNYPVVKDNEPPYDPAHGLVLGKKTGSFANAMARDCQWIVAPNGLGLAKTE